MQNITQREKIFIIAGIATIVVLLLFIALRGVVSWRGELSASANDSRSQISEIDKLAADYVYYKSLQSGSLDQTANTIYTSLDPVLVRHGLKQSVSSMKDTENVILRKYNKITIDIAFKSVDLQSVMRMIYDIEMNHQVHARVEYFKFRKPFAGKSVYDVNIKLASYSMVKK